VNTELAGMTLDRITTEEVDSLRLKGSPAWVNQGLRTLRRLLGKLAEWRVIAAVPTIKLVKEQGRELTIDQDSEAKLLTVGKQPMTDVLVILQDTGMRPDEVFRIRIENIDWMRQIIFNPPGKTRASRRSVPISKRMFNILMVRCGEKREGWLFPSKRAAGGHLTTVAKQFREARRSRLAGRLGAVLRAPCVRHRSIRSNRQPGDGDESDGTRGCANSNALSASGVGSRSRSDRPAEFTSQFTSQ